MSLSPAKQKFVDLATAKYGEGAVLEMAHVTRVREENNLGWPSWFVRPPYRVGRGKFKLPVEVESITPMHWGEATFCQFWWWPGEGV